MDILTPKGQKTVSQELEAVAIFKEHFPSLDYVHTPKDKPARVDAALTRNGEIYAIVETKCRQCTLETFTKEYWSQWLLTWEKLEQARQIATGFQVPLLGFLYLVPDKTLLVEKFSEPDGSLVLDMAIRNTVTQATVNGGEVLRNNAYVSMEKAKVYRSKNG